VVKDDVGQGCRFGELELHPTGLPVGARRLELFAAHTPVDNPVCVPIAGVQYHAAARTEVRGVAVQFHIGHFEAGAALGDDLDLNLGTKRPIFDSGGECPFFGVGGDFDGVALQTLVVGDAGGELPGQGPVCLVFEFDTRSR